MLVDGVTCLLTMLVSVGACIDCQTEACGGVLVLPLVVEYVEMRRFGVIERPS